MTQTPAPQVWPTLTANDARALIRFYVDVFGFEETVVHGEGDFVAHAELSWPEGGGIMMGSAKHDPGNPWNLEPGKFGGYVVTDNPDKVYDRVVTAGARITRAPNDTDYGSREFACTDPEGNLWSFGSYRGSPRA